MATNYLQPGSVLTFIAPSGGVVSGTAYAIGGRVCIALADVAQTLDFPGQINGVWSVTKVGSQAWTVGVAVYVTSGGEFTTSSGGNTAAGWAVEAVGAGADETIGKVLLNGLPAAAI